VPVNKLLAALALGAAALVATGPALVPPAAAAPAAVLTSALPKVGHVWVVVLENKSYAQSFSPMSKAPVLQALARQGALLEQYYGTAHFSLPNYLGLLSGQGPNAVTQSDCQLFLPFVTTGTPVGGQYPGQGCVYPASVPNLASQLSDKGTSWKGYLEDLGASTTRQTGPCGLPVTDALGRDLSQTASATDQYAARHNPFAYFKAVTDRPGECAKHLTPMGSLAKDVASVATTPAFSFLTPNLCDDGHDTGCVGADVAGDKTGNLTAVQHWLTRYAPVVTGSPAFKEDGLLLVTWDEAAATTGSDGTADSTACCNETALNSPKPGGASADISGFASLSGDGGGRVGLIALSPFIRPGTVSTRPYNHYSALRTLEDLYDVPRLGYAGQATGVNAFGPDVFTAPVAAAPPAAVPAVPVAVRRPAVPRGLASTGLGLELPAAALALLLAAAAVRTRRT
jgi:hypothetical protein